jgi:hypothetical protein
LATLQLQLERVQAEQARGKRVEVWFADEARIGQKNSLTRVWGQIGSRPLAPKDLGFASAYVFGAVLQNRGMGTGGLREKRWPLFLLHTSIRWGRRPAPAVGSERLPQSSDC